MISHMLLQTLSGPQFKKKMVKISPALTCLPGLAAGWLYVKELEMWFQQGICVAILRKNGSVSQKLQRMPRFQRSGNIYQGVRGPYRFISNSKFTQRDQHCHE